MSVLIAILIFGIIVTVHEFGHFICAKLSGIRVLEFSVGMGPKLLQKTKGETKYSLRALPLGGYCAMEGEDSTNNDPRSFRNAKLWKRMVVLVAGAGMNFVLGFVVLVVWVSMMTGIGSMTVGGFATVENESKVTEYCAESRETGLRVGDKLIEIGGTRIYSLIDINYVLYGVPQKSYTVIVERDGEKVKLENVVFNDTSEPNEPFDFRLTARKRNPITIMQTAGENFMSMTHIIGLSLKQMFSGKIEKEDVSGPVGVVSVISESTENTKSLKETIFNLLYMTALITINVGIFNLLPIPGLDGGRLLFCFIELIRRKPVKPEHEGYVHLAGMALLFGLMIFATYNDIIKLIRGG